MFPFWKRVPRYVVVKVASLLRSRDPLNSGLLVHYCEEGLRYGEVLRRGEGSLRCCILVALLLSAFLSFLLLLCFFYLLAPLLNPTPPYSIKQYNMRDLRNINEKTMNHAF